METKVCTKCGKELPATTEYFAADKRLKCGLRYTCKECDRLYREENKERMAEYKRKYYEENKEHYKQYREENKERITEYKRKYREENKERVAEYYRQYYEENKERIAEYDRKYREENKERRAEYDRKHREENREYFRSYVQRRNSLKRSLPATLTTDQWQHAQSYFNHSCAYCGSATTLEQDHFWPLSKGGGYTATNIVPACKSCNSSKNNKPFEEWYKQYEHYSKDRERFIKNYLSEVRNA